MHRYEEVVWHIRRRIEAGTLRLGERLPSVRELSAVTGFSMVTIHHAYALLESDGIIAARPRAGFFVRRLPASLGSFADAPAGDGAGERGGGERGPGERGPGERGTEPADDAEPVDRVNFQLLAAWHRDRLGPFGTLYPSEDLFSRRRIGQTLRQVLLRGGRDGLAEAPQGDLGLREVIAKRAAQRGVLVRPQDVLVTGGGLQGLDVCLAAVTKPGDLVLVETPTFFPALAALRRRHLRALEIYSHPITGIDPDQVAHLLERNDVAACLLMPVNHCPTGVTYPRETLQKIARLAAARRIAVIENDIFASLSYSDDVGASLKTFDEEGYVVQFSSLPGLAPSGYGLGWIISERFQQPLLEQQFFSNLLGADSVLQRAAADYVVQGHYDRQLRRARELLRQRMQRGLGLLSDHLPKGSAVSRPAGAFTCWVRGPHGFDAQRAAQRALRVGISLAPGPMFSPSASLRNFLALNFSFDWTPARVEQLRTLAGMLSD